MVKWYSKQLEFDEMPAEVSIEAVGNTKVQYSERKPSLHVTLKIYITRDSETVSVMWNSKTMKLWGNLDIDNITESILMDKFSRWIEKFEAIENKPLKMFILKCAAKADIGVSNWILAMQQSWQ